MHTLPIDISQKYMAESWVDPRLECYPSPINRTGIFARESIKQAEVIVVWGGKIFVEADIKAGRARERSLIPIGEGLYLGSSPDTPESPDEFMNHSCDSNVWLYDEVSLVALRDIAKGEELTLDYALFETDPSWVMECTCGTSTCRYMITGSDWELKHLQVKYRDHFSPYINERIAIKYECI